MSDLAHWDSFYVIVGTAAGALIGLQFVVLTLIAERPVKDMARAALAFANPTIVHFSAVLLVSALLRAPWQAIRSVAIVLFFVGAVGILYSLAVARRMTAQTAYKPDLEDWLYYALLPLAAYSILAVSGLVLPSNEHEGLFGFGAAALILLFIGIRNAWDAVSYHVMTHIAKRD